MKGSHNLQSYNGIPYLSICVNSPSVHSLVLGSNTPYNVSLDIALGSMTCATPSTPSYLRM